MRRGHTSAIGSENALPMVDAGSRSSDGTPPWARMSIRRRQSRHAAVRGPQVWQRFDVIEAAFATEQHGPCWASAIAWELLDLLHDHEGAVAARDPVAALAAIVESGYDRGVCIEDLARDLGIDRSTLFRRFRATYGCSPREWLMQVRLERARDLLLRGELTVAEVASRSGFHDARGFARAFHVRYGSTPGVLRRQRKLSVK